MISKQYITVNGTRMVRVRFTLQSCLWADTIHLVGNMDNWNQEAHPFSRDDSGNWYLVLDLPVGRDYQFRYLCDGSRWMNDPQADGHVRSVYGEDNFVVTADEPTP